MWLNFMGWRCDCIAWDKDVIESHVMKMWLNFMGSNQWLHKNSWCILWDLYSYWVSWDVDVTEFDVIMIWLNCIRWRWDWISSDGNNDCIRIVGAFYENSIAAELNRMYIDKFHGMKMWLNFMWWKCDWISWDENVTEFYGMKMWLDFMGWKCVWISWDENTECSCLDENSCSISSDVTAVDEKC